MAEIYYIDLEKLDDNSSHKIILKQIKPNSTILECGSATGYMTRYMKEKLHAEVYIIEYNEEAFHVALEYAKDGICADLDGDEWSDYFAGKKFDYILFADVLEHLRTPREVLKRAVRLLKDDGTVITSIPNVAHSDILIQMLHNRWHYTSVGLLDNTHIHFWAERDLNDLFSQANLVPVNKDYTIFSAFMTEQRSTDSLEGLEKSIVDICGRKYGDVYQFVCFLQKAEYVKNNNIECIDHYDERYKRYHTISEEYKTACNAAQEIHSKLYFDLGSGYSEDSSETYFSDSVSSIHIHANIPQHTQRIRIDPVEGDCCVLKNLKARSDEGWLTVQAVNGIKLNDLYFFQTTDPQLEVDMPHCAQWIDIKAEILTFSSAFAELERDNLSEHLSKVEAERDSLSEHLSKVEAERDSLSEYLSKVEAERDSLKKRLEQSCLEKEHYLEEKRIINEKCEELRRQFFEAKYAYEAISNAASWKMTKPLRASLDFLKGNSHINKGILAIKYLKKNGFIYTWRKICDRKSQSERINEIRTLEKRTDYPLFESEYQDNQDYSIYKNDIKALAFYLPQFHTFPENDEWWGQGFTEWTNVKKSVPRFEGHYQPRVPHLDIGYYCLDDIEVMRKQVKLAKQHGIYGFCFYYYWFSGKRLMERPVDQLLEHPEINMPFCLCWANENWTRTWDGQENNILIRQKYSDEDDERFIVDMQKYLEDSRYIRINGKPLIIIYNPSAMPDCRKSLTKWRERAQECGIGEIEIWICLTWGRDANMLKISDLVNAEVEFPPHNIGGEWMEIKDVKCEGNDTIVYDYHLAVEFIVDTWERGDQSLLPRHYTCMLAWDNAARRKDGWHAFYRFSLKDFYRWVSEAVRLSRKNLPLEERFIFINAWNEWGEGTYLEPEEQYGYANINTLSKALFDLPYYRETIVITDRFPVAAVRSVGTSDVPLIAVQAHIFYLDLLDEMIRYFNNIPFYYDLYISTDSEEKKSIIMSHFKMHNKCKNLQILVLENRGRDVAPFLVQFSPMCEKYKYVGHFHSKKTVTDEYGDNWREYLFNNLLGSEEYVKRVFGLFEENKDLGLVFPELYPPIREHAKWNGEHDNIRMLLTRMKCSVNLPEQLVFPAGNMFWARTKAVKPLFDLGLTQDDFPIEKGQCYSTIAHQIERSWSYIAQSQGFFSRYIMNGIRQAKD